MLIVPSLIMGDDPLSVVVIVVPAGFVSALLVPNTSKALIPKLILLSLG